MIITKRYAQRLVREGKARLGGQTVRNGTWRDRYMGQVYRILDRLDLQRVDHYLDNS